MVGGFFYVYYIYALNGRNEATFTGHYDTSNGP